MLLALRIKTKTYGLSLSRQNGTVPDRKVSTGQTVHVHHRSAESAAMPWCKGAKHKNNHSVRGMISRTQFSGQPVLCACVYESTCACAYVYSFLYEAHAFVNKFRHKPDAITIHMGF